MIHRSGTSPVRTVTVSVAGCKGDVGTSVPECAEPSRPSRIGQPAITGRFSEPGVAADTLSVDTPSGLSDTASGDAAAARAMPMMIADPPAASRDASSFVRMPSRRRRARRLRPVVNRACSARHARDVHAGLFARTGPGPDVLIESAGTIPDDDRVVQPVRGGCAVVGVFPRSPPALAFTKLAARVASWPGPATPAGRIEYFVERLMQAADPTLVRVTA